MGPWFVHVLPKLAIHYHLCQLLTLGSLLVGTCDKPVGCPLSAQLLIKPKVKLTWRPPKDPDMTGLTMLTDLVYK